MDDHVGGGDQLQRPRGQQPGITGAGTDEVHGHVVSSRSARSSSSPAPAASIRSAQRAPISSGSPSSSSLSHAEPSGRPTQPARVEPPPVSGRAWAPDRGVTRRAEGVDERPFGGDAGHRVRVAHRRQRPRVERARPRLECQRALTGGGDERVDDTARLAGALQPLQPGQRQHQRVDLARGQLAQPGIDVPAHLDDLQVLTNRPQLRRPPQAAGTDPGAGCQGVEPGGAADRIPRIGSLGDGDQLEPVGELGGDVLGGMDRDVDPPVEQGAFQLGDPPGLVLLAGATVTERRHLDDLGVATETVRDPARLRQRECAGPGPEAHQPRRLSPAGDREGSSAGSTPRA